jgi:anti-sigma factor RsiW
MSEGEPEATIRRLLGAGQPQLSCDECFEALDRYVEVEATRVDADAAVPGMAAHLESCPACAEEHASLLALVRSDRHDP